jgi:hypothetical protein
MARPQVVDGEDGLQVWRITANILNKQSHTANKGWSSCLGFGVGLQLTVKNKLVTKCHKRPQTWTEGPVEGSSEHGTEPSNTIKCWEVLQWLRNWRLLKKGSAP